MPNRSAGRTKKQLVAENADLRARLEAAEATLRAIRSAAGPARIGGAPDGSNLVAADQTEHAHVARILATRLRLLEFAATHSLGELLQATLDELELLTGSQIAFCHFLDVDQQTLLLQAWSSNTQAKMCQAEGAGRHYDIADAGVWVDCVRERRPVIHNDYAALPHRTETPAGHAIIVRELVAPVFRHDQIVAILGVGNKPEEYTQHDVEIVVNLADLAWDIAERKRTEEQLRYQSTLLENVNDAIVASDAQYRITAWNAAAESLYGWKAEEVLGLIGIEVTRTEWPASAAGAMRRVIAETGRWRGEATQVRKDGVRFPVEISSIALRDQSGAIIGYVSVNRDITENKQAIEALAASQALYRLLAENSSDAVSMIDADGKVVYVSPAYFRRLGYAEHELLNLDTPGVLQFIHPEDRGHIAAEIQRGRELRLPTGSYEYRARTKRGDYIWLEDLLRRQFDENGNLASAIVNSREITERKQAEAALRQSALQNLATLATAMDGYLLLDLSTQRITDVNDVYCRMSGYSRGELLQMTIPQMEAGERPDDVAAHVASIKQRGSDRFETTHRRKDGSTFPVEVSVQSLGATGEMLSFVRDITERKQAEQERERLQMQLAQAQKMETVGRLAGGIAHDFNNMLAVILMRAELALQMADPGTPLHRSLTAIYTTGQRSAELVRQLQGFARKQTITPKVLDLNAVLANTLPMLDKLIGEDIELHWRPGAQLWPVKMDPVQIDQIMANLCVNARDAIGDVGVITIETANVVLVDAVAASGLPVTPGDYVMIAVSDTGQGMDFELLAHIFEPFYTTKAAGKGTGLGLATVEGIVQQNRGEICVASEPGVGTTFRIYLPRCNEDMALSGDGQFPRLLQGHGETVLLVEDEVAVAQMAAEALNHLGYTVIAATTPSAAIHEAERLPGSAALLITDIIMPEMNGVALAERIAKIQPGIKCLYVSGYPADFVAHRGVLTPDVHFLQKPFSLQDLAMQVRATLGDAG